MVGVIAPSAVQATRRRRSSQSMSASGSAIEPDNLRWQDSISRSVFQSALGRTPQGLRT